MSMSPVSGSSAFTSGIWAQMQQQAAERTADQAESKARSLRAQAEDAQAIANRQQENARSLRVQSQQAQGNADSARQGLASLKSLEKVQTQLGQWQSDLSAALETDTSSVQGSNASSPVTNAQGQVTGALLNVTA